MRKPRKPGGSRGPTPRPGTSAASWSRPTPRQRSDPHDPGGFCTDDDLGAGRIFATRLGTALDDSLRRLHDRAGLILGICNGFQVPSRPACLPGGSKICAVTLTITTRATMSRAGCGWHRYGRSPFLTDDDPIEPGRSRRRNSSHRPCTLSRLETEGQVVLAATSTMRGGLTQAYLPTLTLSRAVAGLCDPTGRIRAHAPPRPVHGSLPASRWTRVRRFAKPTGSGCSEMPCTPAPEILPGIRGALERRTTGSTVRGIA